MMILFCAIFFKIYCKSIIAPQAVRYAVIDPACGGIYFLFPFIPAAYRGVFWTKNKFIEKLSTPQNPPVGGEGGASI